MEVSINSGNKKIISSGTFITFDNKPSEISIQKGQEKIKFEFVFIGNETANPKYQVVTKKESQEELIITLNLHNFNSPLGIGFKEAPNLAIFNNGDKVYLYLWCRSLGESVSKEISYTIYIEENKNG